MNTVGSLVLGTFVSLVAASDPGQQQVLAATSTNHQVGAQNALVVPAPNDQQSRPLFRIGGLPVYVGAPVEPPYNAAANRNLAADPFWGAG
jgi:hypothetical protein